MGALSTDRPDVAVAEVVDGVDDCVWRACGCLEQGASGKEPEKEREEARRDEFTATEHLPVSAYSVLRELGLPFADLDFVVLQHQGANDFV